MRHMSIVFFSLFWSVLPVVGYGETAIEKIIPMDKEGVVEILINEGKITVETWEESQVKVVAALVSGSGELIVESDGNQSIIRLINGNGRLGKNSNTYNIWVPVGASIEGKTLSSSVEIVSVEGSVIFGSINGDISILNSKRKIRVKTTSGDIDLVNNEGEIYAETVSGRIHSNRNSGDIYFRSVAGNITSSLASQGMVDMNSSSGNIRTDLGAFSQGRVKIGTASGDIKVFLDKDSDLKIELNSSSKGKIENLLDIGAEEVQTISNEQNVKIIKMGDGRGRLILSTLVGNIYLHSKSGDVQQKGETALINSRENGVWKQAVKKKDNSLAVSVNMDIPLSSASAPVLRLNLLGRNGSPMAFVVIDDPKCTGSYESQVSYRVSSSRTNIHYFETKPLWSQDIPIKMELNTKESGGFKHAVLINGELKNIFTYKKIHDVEAKVEGGEARISRLE